MASMLDPLALVTLLRVRLESTEAPPFEGLKVIDCASFVAGPAAATILSDLGAEVIKIEPLEGDPYRTNRRFKFLSEHSPAKRLSTAFDSPTLYGFDPEERPDIYGKIGNSGVSIATLDDVKVLFDGFDLCDPGTSVSMT